MARASCRPWCARAANERNGSAPRQLQQRTDQLPIRCHTTASLAPQSVARSDSCARSTFVVTAVHIGPSYYTRLVATVTVMALKQPGTEANETSVLAALSDVGSLRAALATSLNLTDLPPVLVTQPVYAPTLPPSVPPAPPPPPLSPYVEPRRVPACAARRCRIAVLTAEEKRTVQSLASASTTVVGAAAAGAVAVGGAAAVVPLAFAMQRLVLFTNVAGAPANPLLSGVAAEMRWTQGQFELLRLFGWGSSSAAKNASAGSTTRRRLKGKSSSGSDDGGAQKSARDSSDDGDGGDDDEMSETEAMREELVVPLADFAMMFPVLLVGHFAVLMCWKGYLRLLCGALCCCRRKPSKRRVASLPSERGNASHGAHPRVPFSLPRAAPSTAPAARVAPAGRHDRALGRSTRVAPDEPTSAPPSPPQPTSPTRDDSSTSLTSRSARSVRFSEKNGTLRIASAANEDTSMDSQSSDAKLGTRRRPASSCTAKNLRSMSSKELVESEAQRKSSDLAAEESSVAQKRYDLAEESSVVSVRPATLSKDTSSRRSRFASKTKMRRSTRKSLAYRRASIDASERASKEGIPKASKTGRAARIPLPEALVYPNLEVLMVNFFAGGLAQVFAATIVARAQGSLEDGALAALAVCGLIAIVAFFVHELLRMRRFVRCHSAALWTPSEPITHAYEVCNEPTPVRKSNGRPQRGVHNVASTTWRPQRGVHIVASTTWRALIPHNTPAPHPRSPSVTRAFCVRVLSARHQVDDPILRVLTACRICKPALRFRGELIPAPYAAFEPARTTRLLKRPFATWRHANGSDEWASLSTFWLKDVTAGYGQCREQTSSDIGPFSPCTCAKEPTAPSDVVCPCPPLGCYYVVTKVIAMGLTAFLIGFGSGGQRLPQQMPADACLTVTPDPLHLSSNPTAAIRRHTHTRCPRIPPHPSSLSVPTPRRCGRVWRDCRPGVQHPAGARAVLLPLRSPR